MNLLCNFWNHNAVYEICKIVLEHSTDWLNTFFYLKAYETY